MFVAEGGAARLVDLEEKVQNSNSINALALTITSELNKLFPCKDSKGGQQSLNYLRRGLLPYHCVIFPSYLKTSVGLHLLLSHDSSL
jgi:hypothetical protein